MDKLSEFNRFGIDITADKGANLHEVNGTPMEVIIYKAKDAGERKIVEDTSFDVEGLNVGVNVRWLVNKLIEDKTLVGRNAKWTVLLGVNTGNQIKVFSGTIDGIIVEPRGNCFGFDPIFQPHGSEYTLAELDAIGKKG